MRNYISKINDRNLQRKRESGITTYALYSVLIVLLFKVVDQYPLVPFKEHFWSVLFILSCTFTIVIFSLLIYSLYEGKNTNSTSTRLILKNNNSNILEKIINSAVLVVPLISNTSVGLYYFFFKDTLQVYCLINASIMLGAIVLALIPDSEKNPNSSYDIFEGTGKSEITSDKSSIFIFFLVIINIVYGLYLIYLQVEVNEKLNTFVFGVLITLVPLILDKLIQLKKADTFSDALENLEYEINVMDLTDTEIRERLQKNYMGFLLTEWINYNLRELEIFKERIENNKKSLETLKLELKTIDKEQYPIEYKGRLVNISKDELSITTQAEEFFEKKIADINVIAKKSTLELSERNELMVLRHVIEKERRQYISKQP